MKNRFIPAVLLGVVLLALFLHFGGVMDVTALLAGNNPFPEPGPTPAPPVNAGLPIPDPPQPPTPPGP